MTRRRVAPAAGVAGLFFLVLACGPSAAATSFPEVDQGHSSMAEAGLASAGWTEGHCTTKSGVTVVADFTDLGDGVVVRCVTGTVPTGVEALQKAGFAPEGTSQYGLAFVCRIAGRPAADEPLAVKGDPGYTEQCQQTPPDLAHWEYWTAPNGGPWTFSDVGAASSRPVPGGFEGWAFSLNGSHHPPRVTPTHPVPSPSPAPSPSPPSTSAPPPARPTPSPSGTVHSAHASHRASPPATGALSTTGASAPAASHTSRDDGSGPGMAGAHHHRKPATSTGSRTSRMPRQRHHPSARASASATTVSGDAPAQQSTAEPAGSSTATAAGVGLLAVLGAGAGVTAWRRSRRA